MILALLAGIIVVVTGVLGAGAGAFITNEFGSGSNGTVAAGAVVGIVVGCLFALALIPTLAQL